ncbi:MAG: hypothetical protein KJ624_05215 [Chloroflexi bacterium]|nr:hypothetical protein [Chloroflexota bacterium]
MNELLSLQAAIANLRMSLTRADRSFAEFVFEDNEWSDPSWLIEKCSLQLLAIAEAMGLSELHKMILSEYLAEKKSEEPFLRQGTTPDGEPYSLSLSRLRKFLGAVEQFFPQKEPTIISKDLLQIIRDINYTITDKELFRGVPQTERDVHIRIEGILKCVFPDLKHKPALTKQIKNFEPDTGIPSIQTLIEYKFLSSAKDVPAIVEEILADTRGYASKEWGRLIYVIYETNRFWTEKAWIQMLRESGVPENTTIVVLSGEPRKRRKGKKPITSVRK